MDYENLRKRSELLKDESEKSKEIINRLVDDIFFNPEDFGKLIPRLTPFPEKLIMVSTPLDIDSKFFEMFMDDKS